MKKFILEFIIVVLSLITVICTSFAIKYQQLYTVTLNNNSDLQNQSNNTYPIDIELEKCVSKDFMTEGMNNCTYEGIEAWNREIDNYSKQIVEYISPDNINLFNASQSAWQDYYNKEKEFLNNTIAQKDGDIHTTVAIGILYDLTKQKALSLKSYLIDIKD